jgi:hypothetical protein
MVRGPAALSTPQNLRFSTFSTGNYKIGGKNSLCPMAQHHLGQQLQAFHPQHYLPLLLRDRITSKVPFFIASFFVFMHGNAIAAQQGAITNVMLLMSIMRAVDISRGIFLDPLLSSSAADSSFGQKHYGCAMWGSAEAIE